MGEGGWGPFKFGVSVGDSRKNYLISNEIEVTSAD